MMPAALVALTVALLLTRRTAPGRLSTTSGTETQAVTDPVALRPVWALIAVCAAGAVGWAVGGGVTGLVIGITSAGAGAWAARRLSARDSDRTDGVALAGAWELLAVCLLAGLPVAAAVSAAARPLTGRTGNLLRRVAGLLELGADPAAAWHSAAHRPALATFARAAGRSAGTGAALAQVARTEAARIRADYLDAAEARAQRAAVLITGPLGLCFLPAFLVLGIAPVVIGLAGDALARW